MLHLRFVPQRLIYWELHAQCDGAEVIEKPMEKWQVAHSHEYIMVLRRGLGTL